MKKNNVLLWILILFGLIYSSISLVNHYFFRTYALDLGAYTNALYDYVRFQLNDSGTFKSVGENLLADHFDLYLIIFSPLSLVFGTYTLLIVQIASILIGGVGVFAYFKQSGNYSNIPIFASLYFFTFFGVFSALSFDYHSNTVAAALVPWLFYFIKKEKLLFSFIALLGIIISKENVSLWLAFITIGLAFEYRKQPRVRNSLALASIFSIVYFLAITVYVMPALSNNSAYPHFHYSYLGNNFSEAISHLILNPIDSIKVLFINHNNSPFGDNVKLELHLLVLLSGLPILVKKPQYLFMLLPIYFQKLFHDNSAMWGIGGQYSIEFAPIMTIGVFSVLAELGSETKAKFAGVILTILSVCVTVRSLDNTVLFTDKARSRFYQSKHYRKSYDVAIVHQQLNALPPDAVLSAQSPFLPHLALRNDIYQFPMIKNAEYIIYSHKEGTYPVSEEEFVLITDELENSDAWEIMYNQDIVILKRIANHNP